MSELVGRSISELKKLLADKSVSAKEILTAHLKQVQSLDGDIKAFTCLTEERAKKQADKVDENDRARRGASCISRHTCSHQRQHLRSRLSDYMLQQNSGELHRSL